MTPYTASCNVTLCPFRPKANQRVQLSNLLHIILLILGAIGPVAYVVERKMSINESRVFSDAIAAAGAGRWVWYLDKDKIDWDDQMFVIFGRDRSKGSPTHDEFLQYVVPEDRDTLTAEMKKCVENRRYYQAIFRIITDTGETRFVRVGGKVSKDGKYMAGIYIQPVEFIGNSIIPINPQSIINYKTAVAVGVKE